MKRYGLSGSSLGGAPAVQVNRVLEVMAIIFTVLISIAGCGSELFPSEIRVEPSVINEIRQTGKVIAETTVELHWDGETQITNRLIIDVGGGGPEEALTSIRNLLQLRGWVVVGQRLPEWIQMEAKKWEYAHLALTSFDFSLVEGETRIIEIVKKSSSEPTNLVVVDAYPGSG